MPSLPHITLRREAAIGDVIMASGVARALKEAGYTVTLSCKPICAESLWNSDVATTPSQSKDDIILDGAYEHHPQRKTVPKPVIFATVTSEALRQRNLPAPDFCNLAPRLAITPSERQTGLALLERLPRPWIAVGPRSNSWPQRTVLSSAWAEAARLAGFGSWLWTGTDPAPAPCIDLKTHTIRRLMSFLCNCDLMVCVDSGPMHIAAGLGIPVIAIKQACSPELHLTDQHDYNVIGTGLSCLNCHEAACPIDAKNPPCGLLSPSNIVEAVQSKLRTKRNGGVSAVIPVFGTPKGRLKRCVEAVLPQVDEVVVVIDGGSMPKGVPIHPRLRFLAHPSTVRHGYGKNCNYGARHTTGTCLLLLNDDVYLEPGAVAAMKQTMLSHPCNAVVGCRLWYPNGTIQHGGTSRLPGNIGWGHVDHRQTKPSVQVTCEMENVSHAAALIRREAFYAVRCYDERYDCYNEDNDFNLAVRRAGWKVVYEPAAEGIHDESQSTGSMKADLSAASYQHFKARWGWYFERNKDNNMGVFV